MKKISFLIRYIIFFLNTLKKVVPSVFEALIIEEIITKKGDKDRFLKIERLREELKEGNRGIYVTDFGATAPGRIRKKSYEDIIKNEVKPARQAQILFRLVEYFKPKNILEFGTSLGFSSMYLKLGAPDSKFITMEGCPQKIAAAKKNFDTVEIKGINAVCGEFNTNLDSVISKLNKLDLVYFDGNHKKEATISYFEKCLENSHEDSIFIFDDIYWSTGMKEAWNIIKAHKDVTLTIDLFFMGFVFFKKDIPKNNIYTRI